ncbi:17-beta-hydroxysteroid dehydrogenase type 6-like [Ornithodoros turicata]|uniref:17-beta-hydroxysteroid dehydrogenase type 6-like n=1 Tax=Ornithodoros turicata TaxID=34597 RepID=UPI003139C8BC
MATPSRSTEDFRGARERLMGMILITCLTFIVLNVTSVLSYMLSMVSNVLFALVVGYNLADCIDRRYRKEVRLKDPTVFITGCDSGIGLHAARRLHEHGFDVFAGCLDPNSDGAAILKELHVTIVPIDYLEEDSIIHAYKTVTAQLGDRDLWGIVANAGVVNYGEVEWMSYDEIRWVVNVNLSGTLRFIKEGIPLLRRSRGRIVVMSGVHGRHAIPGIVAASAASAGLCSIGDGLRRELCKWHIGVSTIEPMLYRTRVTEPENVRIGIMELLSRVPQSVKDEYGTSYMDAYKSLLPKRLHRYMHVNLNDISRAIHCALTDTSPKARYRCGGSDMILALFLELLPTEVVDTVINSVFQPRCRVKTVTTKSG